MPLIVLAGEEELLIEERLEALKTELLDPNWASFNYSRQDSCELKDLVDAAAALPFGPGNKIIEFSRCGLFTKKRGGKSDNEDEAPTSKSAKKASSADAILDDLDKALGVIAPNTYLILVCQANFDSTLKAAKVISKHTQPEEFKKFEFKPWSDNAALFNWCRKRAKQFQCIIDDEAIVYLIESTDVNLRQIAQEIEKAAIYLTPEKGITRDVVSHLSPHHSSNFALIDHWIFNRREKVLESLNELEARHQPAMPILALMQGTLSKWIKIKTAADEVLAGLPGGRGIQRRELPAADMAKRIQGSTGLNFYILKGELEKLTRVELTWLLDKKKQLTRLEGMTKSGKIGNQEALTLFFVS